MGGNKHRIQYTVGFRGLLYFLNVARKILYLSYLDMAEMDLLVLLELYPTVLCIGNLLCIAIALFSTKITIYCPCPLLMELNDL